MRKRKKVVYIASVASFFLAILLIVFVKRNDLLNYLIQSKVHEIEREKNVSIHYENLRVKGGCEIMFDHFSVLPQGGDTLVKADRLKIAFDLMELLKFNVAVERLEGAHLSLTFSKQGARSNYDFLFRKRQAPTVSSDRDYGKQLSRLSALFFGLLPERAEVKDLYVSMNRDGAKTALRIPDCSVTEKGFSTLLQFYNPGGRFELCRLRGEFQPSQHQLRAELTAAKGGAVRVPGLERWKADVSFDRLSFGVKEEREGMVTALTGSVEIRGLNIVQADLSARPVRLDKAGMEYVLEVGKEGLEVSERSSVRFNELEFHPFFRAQKGNREKWKVVLAVNKPFFPASHLFSSFPQGLFETCEGLQVTGELAYRFLLDVDFANLDSLRLESELTERNFRITDFGNGELAKLNRPFLYTAYDGGIPVRTFEVGPANPGFLPLDSISPLLRAAVLQSEDGSFFSHRGFRLDALREALIYDLKLKRFARGGSTISMQLVKNVFLNRNKNLFRKLEEALLVWLIENEGLASKHRMYEIYLNICEWGPGVYGAREASRFYFSKAPSQLTVEEAIFLASLVPRPKRYRSQFTSEGALQPWLTGYFNTLARLLARNGLISEEEAISIQPSSVRLSGPAAFDFAALPADSLKNDEAWDAEPFEKGPLSPESK